MTLDELIAFGQTDAAQAQWENRWSDPVYLRLHKAMTRPLHGIPVIYMFIWGGGVVKVGQTRDFYSRRSAHVSDPLVAGLPLEWEGRWPTDRALEHERILIDICSDAGGIVIRGREWFQVDPDALADAVDRWVAAHAT